MDKDLSKILMLISAIFGILLKILEYLQSAYFLGIVRSINLKLNHNINKILF